MYIFKYLLFIIISLMNNLKYGIDGIKEIICDYIINCKNEELLVNEKTLNKCFADFVFNNETILDHFCVISSHILKEYKFENYMTNNNNSKSNNNSIFTGDNAYIIPVAVVLIISLTGIIIVIKKRNEEH